MNPMIFAYIAGAVFAGMLVPIQTGFNMQLARGLGSSLSATLVIFGVGFFLLLGVNLALRMPVPSASQAAGVQPLAWVGGAVIAMVYVTLLTALAPKLGAAPIVACVVLGQVFCSLVIDHFGLLGFEANPISATRMAGVVLLLAGVGLIRFS